MTILYTEREKERGREKTKPRFFFLIHPCTQQATSHALCVDPNVRCWFILLLTLSEVIVISISEATLHGTSEVPGVSERERERQRAREREAERERFKVLCPGVAHSYGFKESTL